ncbi:hypothetical protein GCM10010298_24740 [Streptomyces microflavus]|uniref:Uncharacterized protein n=1 Tax=Streptomyces microflavus TaxID=1919 RepID=A0A7J0D333_STRMI|nr:hypothetical protein Smic_76870 [Streptomyces microflavus]GGX59029.1 hypothetical protein GCM10010298_24740 [Streptomyces microflavus]
MDPQLDQPLGLHGQGREFRVNSGGDGHGLGHEAPRGGGVKGPSWDKAAHRIIPATTPFPGPPTAAMRCGGQPRATAIAPERRSPAS